MSAATPSFLEQSFDTPIDAVSTEMHEGEKIQLSFYDGEEWSKWQELEFDIDRGPTNTESELIMLPDATKRLRFRGLSNASSIHPITVSREPVRTLFAAINLPAAPLVISRSSWGADESLLFSSGAPSTAESSGETSGGSSTTTPSSRVSDCDAAQLNYPQEFKTTGVTVRTDAQGRTYRWPQTFSKEVKLLVVHHTALKVTGDPRPGPERIRALYKYHADSRGWGDVGYNYLIDEEGKIYEGREGGRAVVSGHAYCNNVGTIGIALLGNFELEAPTAKQTTALQTLLLRLADEYSLDLARSTQFHGKTFTSPIVRHKDLLSTSCPGYYLADAFGQVVQNAKSNNPTGVVKYAVIDRPILSTVEPPTRVATNGMAPGLSYIGRTTVSLNPGGQQRMSFIYTAPLGGAYEGKKVAEVRLGHTDLSLFLTQGSYRIPVRSGILLPSDVPDGESISIQLIVQAPQNAGTYWMEIGGLKFILVVSGRRTRTDINLSRFGNDASKFVNTDPKPTVATPVLGRVRTSTRRSLGGGVSSSVRPTVRPPVSPSTSTVPPSSSTDRPLRIKLSATSTPTLLFTQNGHMDGTVVLANSRITLRAVGSLVQAIRGSSLLAEQPILRFSADGGSTLTVDAVRGGIRSYRGTIEVRVVDGELILINELPLETYMRGLAEEPDTEPYEKQRAFAIAARTYAAWYMNPQNRKFPGKPFDGSDDPAIFQSYTGEGFEKSNPAWLRAVASTSKQVLTYNGSIIKPPYFSSDDGRTKSPEEAGWKNFPFADIFLSKTDPWCRGMQNRGHGVGMSGCGAKAQALEGKTAEQILKYYYPGTVFMGQ